jgi:hypothetical protein
MKPTFRRRISPLISESKSKPSKKPAETSGKIGSAGFLFALLSDPEDGGDMFLRSVDFWLY